MLQWIALNHGYMGNTGWTQWGRKEIEDVVRKGLGIDMKGVRGRRRDEYESTFYASMEFSKKT